MLLTVNVTDCFEKKSKHDAGYGCLPKKNNIFMGRCCEKDMAGVALILSAGLEVPTHPEHLHSNPNKLRKNPGDSPQGSTFPSRVVQNLNKLKIRINLSIWMHVCFCI